MHMPQRRVSTVVTQKRPDMIRFIITAFIFMLAVAPLAAPAANDLVIKPVGSARQTRVSWVPPEYCKIQGSQAVCSGSGPSGSTITAYVLGQAGSETCYVDFRLDKATGRWSLKGIRGSLYCRAKMVGGNVIEFGGR